MNSIELDFSKKFHEPKKFSDYNKEFSETAPSQLDPNQNTSNVVMVKPITSSATHQTYFIHNFVLSNVNESIKQMMPFYRFALNHITSEVKNI
jgi:hypothetical protein